MRKASASALHRADGDRSHDDKLPRRSRTSGQGWHRCFGGAFSHDQAAGRGAVLYFADGAELLVTVEEGIRIGGFGSAVTDVLSKSSVVATPPILRLGLPDAFPNKYGLQDDLFEIYGLTPAQIAARTLKSLKVKDKVA